MTKAKVGNPSRLNALCVECGLCCSGAIFDTLKHDPAEDDFISSLGPGSGFVESKSENTVAQPCPHLCGTTCGIYDRRRPKTCGDYFCELARGVDRGAVQIEDAHSKIAEAHRLLGEVEEFFEAGETIVKARFRWRDRASELRTDPKQARFVLLMTSLNLLLDRHFRRHSQQFVHFESE